MDRIGYTEMLQPRPHYALMATEERVRSRLRERALVLQLQRTGPALSPAPERPGRWIVAGLVSLFVPGSFFGGEPRPQED
jgi:hypothetical protein